MFGRLLDIESLGSALRALLTWMAVMMLAPTGLVILLAVGLVMVPAAIVGIPFMLPVFFGTAADRRDVARASHRGERGVARSVQRFAREA